MGRDGGEHGGEVAARAVSRDHDARGVRARLFRFRERSVQPRKQLAKVFGVGGVEGVVIAYIRTNIAFICPFVAII